LREKFNIDFKLKISNFKFLDKLMQQILEGSDALARAIKNINPAVISAYPITPQTHIVEHLAQFKADGEADYEFVRAESEFAAASIVLGAAATGVRTYTATSSQGLLLMMEVLYNIAGMRLPVVLTCATRAISAPINIWHDHQDAMAARDTGWIMLFAETVQESIKQHIMAYKIAEQTKLPVMLCVDGFIMTHIYEPVTIPDAETIQKYLGEYKPKLGEYLNVGHPITMGALVTPTHYMEIRQELQADLLASKKVIAQEYENYKLKIKNKKLNPKFQISNLKFQIIESGLLEYYGPKNPKMILVVLGSLAGTIKEVIDENKKSDVGLLRIKSYRPFPAEEVLAIIKKAKNIAVIEKALSLGNTYAPLATDIKAVAQGKLNTKIKSFVVGLGGRDVTKKEIRKIISSL
jgi:pyruvate ferredoxin oxidoreductase alpha subunit